MCVPVALAALAGPCAAASSVAWPITNSANQRYLVDQTGAPFLIHGDAPWSLIVALTREEVDVYLDNRRLKGFNTLLVNLIEHQFDGDTNPYGAPRNRYNAAPFTTAGNFNTPNETYFAHADWVINRAAEKGFLLLLTPCYLGYPNSSEGWYQEVLSNGNTSCRNYGRFVGARYAGRPNIIWVMGGDHNPDSARTMVDAMAAGIREFDTTHLMTAHCIRAAIPRQQYSGSTWYTLNNVYDGHPMQTDVLSAYQSAPTMPAFMLEGYYEGDSYGLNTTGLRAQAYTSLLAGACGDVFGNASIWPFRSSWQTAMNLPGSVSMSYVRALWESRDWANLVPDSSHTVVTAGYGSGTTWVGCARSVNGNTVFAYLPQSSATITVNLTKVSGANAAAWWFNPRDGTVSAIGTFATSGTRTFARPDSNDWVLVLDDASLGLAPPGSASAPLQIVTTTLPNGTAGIAYSAQLQASGGVPPYAWSLANGSGALPPGVTLSSGGLASGTPTANGVFSFTVQAVDATASATRSLALSIAAGDTTPPEPPDGLTAVPASPTQVNLGWNAASDNVGVTAYLVERQIESGAFGQIASVSGTSHNDTGLTAGTNCSYRVRSRDAAGYVSTYSAVVATTTPDMPPPNTGPSISNIGDQTTTENVATPAVAFIVSDAETSAGALTLTRGSTNTALVPVANIVFGGSAGNRTVTVTPAANQSGAATITVTVSDGLLTASDTFVVTVNPASGGSGGTATFSNAAKITIPSSGASSPNPSSINVAGTGGVITDVNVVLRGMTHWNSDDLDVLLVGPGGQAILLLSDAGGTLDLNGYTLTFDDAATATPGDASAFGTGTFRPANYGAADTFAAPAPGGTYATSLSVFNGQSANGTWSLYVMDDTVGDAGSIATGWSLIITTSSGSASDPAAPTIGNIQDQITTTNTATAAVAFTIADADTATSSLTVSAASSNPTLVPVGNVAFGGSAGSRTVTVTPATDQTGAATITVTVSDGVLTATDTFVVTVNPAGGGTGGTATFSNAAKITIPSSGASSPNPSPINVAGTGGVITDVNVVLRGMTHQNSDDLDILLVGPGGQSILLLSDAGGTLDLNGYTLTFDDAATATPGDASAFGTGTYRPVNYGAADTFAAPAPGGTYGTSLSVFNGQSANGTWSLYVMDDTVGDAGSIATGWSLVITTQ